MNFAMTALAFVLLMISVSVSVFGQQPPATMRTTEQQFKNIQVLNGLRADQMNLTMHGISGQLGVDCVHCHVWEEWDKDVKPAKIVARRIITLVRDLNKEYFGGAQVITCYTCHRGSLHPRSAMVLPDTANLRGMLQPPPPPPTEEVVEQKPVYPSAESILARYVQALGGEQALRKVTSRVITAKRDYPAGPAGLAPVLAEVEIYQRAPNLTVMISKAEKLAVSEGFDGQAAWAQTANGNVNSLPEPDQQRAKRSADFYESLDLAKNYDRPEVSGIKKVNGHDAYVINAYPSGDKAEKLYFDTKMGLLLRRWASFPTLIADYPYQIDYDDYRKTGAGVLFPFVVRIVPAYPRAEPKTNSTLQIVSIKENVAVDIGKFVRPQPKAPASPGR